MSLEEITTQQSKLPHRLLHTIMIANWIANPIPYAAELMMHYHIRNLQIEMPERSTFYSVVFASGIAAKYGFYAGLTAGYAL